MGLVNSKQSQAMAVHLIEAAKKKVTLTAYTYDFATITQALIKAARRQVPTCLIVDRGHALTGSTEKMIDRMKELQDGGVTVLLSYGQNGSTGAQHSKTVTVDEYLLIGSCNWTCSSRTNHEMNVLIKLGNEGSKAHEERLSRLRRFAVPFSAEFATAGKERRESRHRSVPPADRSSFELLGPSFAKRFSLARARSFGRGVYSPKDGDSSDSRQLGENSPGGRLQRSLSQERSLFN